MQEFFSKITPLLKIEFLGNSVLDYLNFLIAFFVFLLIFNLLNRILFKKLTELAKKTKTDIDDAILKILNSIRPPFYSFIAFYLALSFLTIKDLLGKIIDIVLIIWVTYQIIIAIQILIDYVADKRIKQKLPKGALSFIKNILKGTLWGFGILMILSNLGINVTSLIAGLGIGGIAVAFAVRNILEDLFSSFSIYFDRPFEVGDFIAISDREKGTVEKIGIKTTRIRSFKGEEIVVSNTELTSSKIHNYGRIERRRQILALGVTYETPLEKLKKIPKYIEKIIKSEKLTEFDRCHFKEYGDFALLFEVSFYVLTSDYKTFLDINQNILFKIKEKFEKEKIEFAYPTQTIFINKI